MLNLRFPPHSLAHKAIERRSLEPKAVLVYGISKRKQVTAGYKTAQLVPVRNVSSVSAMPEGSPGNLAHVYIADDAQTTSFSRTPQENALVEQLQALFELSTAQGASSLQPPAKDLQQQLGLSIVTTSQQVSTSTQTPMDTMQEEAEDGGGDGMAALTSSSVTKMGTPPPRPGNAASSSKPPSVLAALRQSSHVDEYDEDPSSPEGRAFFGWGQSALQQLQARKAFADLHGVSDVGAASFGLPGFSKPKQATPAPRFDPMDTLDDDEDGYGIEAAAMPYPSTPSSPSLWGRGAAHPSGKGSKNGVGAAAGFIGNVSTRLASSVGGFTKSAAKKVVKSVEKPIANSVAITSDAAAAVGRAAQKSGEAVAAAAAGAVSKLGDTPAVVKTAAVASAAAKTVRGATDSVANAAVSVTSSVVTAAKAAPARVFGSGSRSTWMVVDSQQSASDNSPVRCVVVSASPDLAKLINQVQKHQAATELVTFENDSLGVMVPPAVYTEASNIYNTLLPLLMDFIADNPDGRICFSGNGAGGSLATVLGLMCTARGLRPHVMNPCVVAFDAPPVLAEVVDGALWGCGVDGHNQEQCADVDWQDMVADVTARGLLSELGLPRDAVLNISSAADVSGAATATASSSGSGVKRQAAEFVQRTSKLVAAATAAATKLSSSIMHYVPAVAGSGGAASSSVPAASPASRSGPDHVSATGGDTHIGASGPAVYPSIQSTNVKLSQAASNVINSSVQQPYGYTSSYDEDNLGADSAGVYGGTAPQGQIRSSTDHNGSKIIGIASNKAAYSAPGASPSAGHAQKGGSTSSHNKLQVFKLVGEVRHR